MFELWIFYRTSISPPEAPVLRRRRMNRNDKASTYNTIYDVDYDTKEREGRIYLSSTLDNKSRMQ